MPAINTTTRRESWNRLNQQIVDCTHCPRLIEHCRQIARDKRKAYQDWDYWGKPVPNFGDPNAKLLIVGLAPGAHGANRTGRMFTGDRSGDWLYRALCRTGFASQEQATSMNDRLKLKGCAITNVCHCAPPDNKPTTAEVANCQPWLDELLDQGRHEVFVVFGQIGWRGLWVVLRDKGWCRGPIPKFGHGVHLRIDQNRSLLASYHPSQQNTFTGRLTEKMLENVFKQAKNLLGK